MTRTAFMYTTTMLLLAALATSAYATRIFSGTACQISDPTKVTGIPDYDFAGMFNDSTAVDVLYVTCPVVRDNTSNTNGTRAFQVTVMSNGLVDVVCTLYSLDEKGVYVDSRVNTTPSNVPATLDLAVNLSAQRGYYNMICSLPPGGKIFNYMLWEY